jgi:SAM-dependent methyltransferase
MKERYFEVVSELCEGKNLLEYGCGTGSASKHWLELGARVTGIDISEEAIKRAKENIENSGFDADYYVMDAEDTEFDDGSFDLVVGTGILHHLDLRRSYQELSRICNTSGHVVFAEPLGHNPLISLFRLLTPKMRTRDEHPLKLKDIALLNRYFKNVEFEYFSLFTLLSVPFRNMTSFDKINDFFRVIDKAAFSIPFLGRYAWMVVIHASNPRK